LLFGHQISPRAAPAPQWGDTTMTDAAGKRAPSGAVKASWARKLGRLLTRWWSQTPDGRTYQRRRADALAAAAGLGVVVVCGLLVAHRLTLSADVALFHRINHWPGWLYPPMWTAQLAGVIGALPPLAAAAALSGRLRLAAALASATLLKVSLEDGGHERLTSLDTRMFASTARSGVQEAGLGELEVVLCLPLLLLNPRASGRPRCLPEAAAGPPAGSCPW
jgi:hypothetical protein